MCGGKMGLLLRFYKARAALFGVSEQEPVLMADTA